MAGERTIVILEMEGWPLYIGDSRQDSSFIWKRICIERNITASYIDQDIFRNIIVWYHQYWIDWCYLKTFITEEK